MYTSVQHISNNSRRCLQISKVIYDGLLHSALIEKTDNATFKSQYLFNFGAILQILCGCCSHHVGTSSMTSDISMTCDIVDVTCMTMQQQMYTGSLGISYVGPYFQTCIKI